MKSVLAVSVVGTLCFLGTAFDPALEMWAPLIVSVVPLLVFMMWPARDPAAEPAPGARKTAA